ncbi:PAS domain S-box protein [Halopseudomonas pachastrellae]|nr:PAS domain S-box protein [Halopseudomonas pachastrellae]
MLADAAEGRLLAVNQTFEEQFGLTASQAEGRTVTELGLWPEPDTGPGLLTRLNTQPESNLEVCLRRLDGSEFVGLLSSRAVSLDEQPILVVVIRDISALKLTQEQLRLSEQKFSRAFHASPDGC